MKNKNRSVCRTQVVLILIGACFSGCASTGDAWRSDGRNNTAERRMPEFVES